MLDAFLGMFSHDIGIDLGTANTLVYVRDRGIVISEPSVVAIEARTRRVLAIGAEAKRMVGRTPANIIAIRPLRDGVISEFDVTEQMIKYFVAQVHDRVGMIARPRMLLGIPSGVTEVEKRAVRDAALNAGARWAGLIEQPMAAAIGPGLPVGEPSGSLVVDIGGGTTEVAVISLGGIVVSKAIRVGGDEMDVDIVNFARREYNLFLGERTAEDIKIAIGSAYPGEWDQQRVNLRGRDLLPGLPRRVEVGADQIREAIEPSVQQIVDTIRDTIEETPPELVADIMDQGIVLAGGGALLPGGGRRGGRGGAEAGPRAAPPPPPRGGPRTPPGTGGRSPPGVHADVRHPRQPPSRHRLRPPRRGLAHPARAQRHRAHGRAAGRRQLRPGAPPVRAGGDDAERHVHRLHPRRDRSAARRQPRPAGGEPSAGVRGPALAGPGNDEPDPHRADAGAVHAGLPDGGRGGHRAAGPPGAAGRVALGWQ